MGLFDFFRSEKKRNKSKFFDHDYDELIDFEISLDSLNTQALIDGVESSLYDYPYWYSFIKGRAEGTVFQNRSEDQYVKEFVYGHSNEYSKRLQDSSRDEKIHFIEPRVSCYGAIHDLIIKLEGNIKIKYPKNNILISRLHNENLHSKASVYGAVKFAITNNIEPSLIKKWYPNINETYTMQLLSQEDNPIQKVLEKYLIGDEEDRMSKRYELYELNEIEKQEIPFWLRNNLMSYGFFKKGRQVTNKENNKSIKLNRIERTCYWHFKCLSFFLNKMPDNMNNHQAYIEPYETSELIKNYFKKENPGAFSILIEEQQG